MKPGHSSNLRLYLAVWFPWLPTDRLSRGVTGVAAPDDSADEPDTPLVVAEKVSGCLRLSAVDPAAARQGLSPGLTLADARARLPVLRVVTAQPEADEALLGRALQDFDRFSPMIALDPPHGLMLDVTGCLHLFGGEAGLLRAVRMRSSRAGLNTRCALASTPQAARALSRFGQGGVFDPKAGRAAVRRLPVEALELGERETQALRRAGLKRLGDLDDRPRAPLAARFGAEFPVRLARVLGDEDIRITPHRPAPSITVDRLFFEPISADEDVKRVLSDLLAETMARLESGVLGARAFEASFYGVDGGVRRITVRAGRATRDDASVLRLFRERLGALDTPLDPGFGLDQIRMAALAVERLMPAQAGLMGEMGTPNGDLGVLIDRLVARLGPAAVLRFRPQSSHIPERAARWIGGGADPNTGPSRPTSDPDHPPLRPLYLFNPPQPVETLAEAPDGHPFRFRWRRVVHNVARAEGPERIAGEWWRAPGQRTRDYYRVEDTHGRRFWLFRQGLYGEEPPPRWFIHGLFA